MKSKLLAGIFLIICLLSGHGALAQIIDDTTKVLYSPRTTLQLYEKDVLEGIQQRRRVDTSIHNMHNERYWYNDTSYYQHLGNVGTAAQPLLFRMPDEIGVRLGKKAFDRYAYDPDRINYFDTRSPYSHLYYVQGQRGEQVFEGIYARNINERWNAGVAYQILSANKQIGFTNRRAGLIDNQAVKAFSHYASKNKRYDLFFNYTLMKHEQIEFGGIRPLLSDRIPIDLFGYETEDVFLDQAATEESRNNLHATSIFKLAGENLKLYHTFDWHRQVDEYEDGAFTSEDGIDGSRLVFYPDTLFTSVRTSDRTNFRQLQNVFGVTGNSKISYYNAYMKYRHANVEYSVVDYIRPDSLRREIRRSEDATFNQLFVGGELRLFYENKAEVKVKGEFLVSTDYHVEAQGKLAGLRISQERLLRSPSLVEQYMLSNHFKWDNDNFSNSVFDRTEVGYEGRLGGRQYVKLSGNFTNIKRYIYFDTLAMPQQLTGSQRILGAELGHRINFGPIFFENYVAYTNTDEADKIRVPEWLLDSKLYFQGFLFKKALYGQFGIQAVMPSEYFADAYMPVTQQFYLQNDFLISRYPVIDVFINADIKTLNVFLKMSHVNDELWEPGYFVTPYYPGMRRSFIFGLKWMFFD